MLEAREDGVSEFVEVVKIVVEEEDVIEVDYEVVCVDEVLEDGVHKGLEGCGSVAKAEGHDCGFKKALFALEGGFPFVALFDANVVVSPSDVEFCIVAGALEFVDEVGDQG